MAKNATTKKVKEETLETILFNCRDYLRGKAQMTDKRDLLLTLVFIKFLVDDMTIYADFINNNNLKSKLSNDLMMLLYKSGYPPVWNQEVFQKIMEQVDNYKYNQ